MRQLSSFDIHCLLSELKVLENGKVQKIYQIGKDVFYFAIHVTGKGKQILSVRLPSMLFLSAQRYESEENPPQFCMKLRKSLSGGRVRKVTQLGFERIIKLEFETKENKYHLYIELLPPGNVVLCDDNDKIISLLSPKRWGGRTLRGGTEYKLPDLKNDLSAMDEKGFIAALENSERDSVVKTLAIEIGMGGLYAEEVLARAKVDKAKNTPDAGETKRIWHALKHALDQKLSPLVTREDDTLKDALPFPFESLPHETEKAESFSAALEEVIGKEVRTTQTEGVEKKRNAKVEELRRIIHQQEETVKTMLDGAEENEAIGNLIYERYKELEGYLQEIKKARKKLSLVEIKERLKGHENIVEFDTKEKRITVKL
ncbi:MAG: NFACT family protein [archaeon]